jgi:hypothetical protein
MIERWLWFDKKPYHKECILKILTDKVTYCWNELRSDKSWQKSELLREELF